MFLLKLALRNLFRHTRRSILTMVSVIVGIFGLIASSGLVNGIEQSYIRIEIETESAHLRVMHKDYLKEEENLPLDMNLPKRDEVKQAILQKWPQAIPTERIIFSVQIGDGTDALQARGVGIDAQKLEELFRFSRFGSKKARLTEGKEEIYLGVNLAKSFKKKPGDTLTLLARTQAGSFNALDFTIADVIESGNTMVDAFSVYLPMQTARRFLQMPKDATDLIVRFPHQRNGIEAAAYLKRFSGSYAQDWKEKTKTIIELNQMRRGMLNFLILMILLVAAAGIANTILMSAFERRGEIGMMMALGMREGLIIRLFALEAAILGLLGSLVGAFLGSSVSLYYQHYGLNLAKTMASYNPTAGGMSMATSIYFQWDPRIVGVGLALGVTISILASLWPSWRTTRLDPREVMAKN